MLTGADDDVEIAGRASMHASIALASQTDSLSIPRSGLDADLERIGVVDNSRAPASRAPILSFTSPIAIRTLNIEFHPAPGLGHLSTARAPRASFLLANQSFAAAVRAAILAGDLQAHHRSPNGVPEAYVDLVFKIRTCFWFVAGSRATSGSKDVGEDVM